MKNLLDTMKEAANNGTAKVLTLEVAQQLKGKKIQTIYFGYRGQDGADEFIVGDIVSAWDFAARNIDAANFPQGNQQLYWASYMTERQMNEYKNKMILLDENGKDHYIYCFNDSREFDIPTFTCSDSDRRVLFMEVEVKGSYVIKHNTKGYFQLPNNWIYRQENANWATKFSSIDKAEEIAKTLKSSDGKPLAKLEIVILGNKEPEFGFRAIQKVKTIANA